MAVDASYCQPAVLFSSIPPLFSANHKSACHQRLSYSMWTIWLAKPDESIRKYAGGGIVTPRRRYGRSQSVGFFPWNQYSTMYIGVFRYIHRTPENLCSAENIVGLAAVMFIDRYNIDFQSTRIRINQLKKKSAIHHIPMWPWKLLLRTNFATG